MFQMKARPQTRTAKRFGLAALLLLVLVLCLVGGKTAQAGNEQVYVVVENRTFSTEAGAAWDGVLAEGWVSIQSDSTAMDAVLQLLEEKGYRQTGGETGYITAVQGLTAGDATTAGVAGAEYDGWMGTLNDWFPDQGMDALSLETGDVVRLLYSLNMGADVGSDWSSMDTQLADLECSAGTLTPDFSGEETAYTLTLEEPGPVTLTPTAVNKNFQVRIQQNDGAYLRWGSRTLELADGDQITVTCGDPTWPSMNGGATPTSYQITVQTESAAQPVSAAVEVSMQQANTFFLTPQTISVSSDLAEGYGYADQVAAEESVSGLDALVATLEKLYGEDFQANPTEYLQVSGSMAKVLDPNTAELSASFSFAMNGDFPYDPDIPYDNGYTGYGINQAPMETGDNLEFFFYQDSMYMDYYVWFTDAAGTRIASLTVPAGEPFTLGMQGVMYMFGYLNPEDRVTWGAMWSGSDAQIATVDGGVLTPISDAITDAAGQVTLCLDAPGQYILSAYSDYAETYECLFSPWLVVTVEAAAPEAPVFTTDLPTEPVSYGVNEPAAAWTVEATAETGAQLSYQWWSSPDQERWTRILGETSATYTPVTTTAGTTYYKVEATATRDGQTASAESRVATVTVEAQAPSATLASLTGTGVTLDPAFQPENYGPYRVTDRTASQSSLTLKVTSGLEGASVTARYTDCKGTAQEKSPSSSGSVSITNLRAGENTIQLAVTPPENSAYQAATYTLQVCRAPGLKSVTLTGDGLVVDDFSANTQEYTGVMAVGPLTFAPVAQEPNTTTVTVNGQALVEGQAQVSIVPGENVIQVRAEADGVDPVVYTYTITGAAADGACTFTTIPADGVVQLYDAGGALIQPTAEKSYTGLLRGQTYTYTVSKYGYITATGAIVAGEDTTRTVTLESATGGLDEVDAAWKNFRNSDANNGVTNRYTPRNAEETTLLWSAQLGTGWTAVPSVQIIVDNSLVLMSGSSLYKLDLATGAVVASAAMAGSPSFGYTPPTYGEGMLFVPLGGGKVQAFDAKTLESLWVYTDPLGGQALTPITYSDGYVYTGFYVSETAEAAYVCLSVTDEDPSAPEEAKSAVWRDIHAGGFYWAGSLVVGDAVIYGGDNGQSGDTESGSFLVSRNKYTGELLSSLPLTGDQRSTIAYENGQVFFTSKTGTLWRADVDATTGQLSGLTSRSYPEQGNQSVSTPVIYDGRVYFTLGNGLGGSGSIVAVDAASLELLWNVEVPAYPQCSLLLSTAYADTGDLYLYATYNGKPGGVKVVQAPTDAAGNGDVTISDLYDAAGYENFCICSLICDENGTLYYKNDSGSVFALAGLYPVETRAEQGRILVTDHQGGEVAQALAGTELTVSVTANTGWQVAGLTLNGQPLSLTDGQATFRMPAGGAELVAAYERMETGVQVEETEPEVRVSLPSDWDADVIQAVEAALSDAAYSGLATAADDFVQQLAAQYPDHTLRIQLSLVVAATGGTVNGQGDLTELELQLTPTYQLFLEDSDTAADQGDIPDGALTAAVTILLTIPDGMELGENTRLQQDGAYLQPTVDRTAGTFFFRTSRCGDWRILADASIAQVKFYLQGGESSQIQDKETVVYFPEDLGDRLPTPSQPYGVFLGWYDDADGDGDRYTNVSADLPDRLYAVWSYTETEIEVSFRLIGDWLHEDGMDGHDEYITWIETTDYTMEEGDTVYDLLCLALEDAGVEEKGASKGYITAVQAPEVFGGYWLEEFDNGPRSGWMISVNGAHPDLGVQLCVLEDGDEVICHYVDDYAYEVKDWSGGSQGNSSTWNGWLDAEDISPVQWLRKYGDASHILTIQGQGTVEPDTDLEDYLGKNVTFTFTPAAGWVLEDVVVDGKSQGPVSRYTYKDLAVTSRIKVIFVREDEKVWFSDVPTSYWAYGEINDLVELGVVQGRPDGTFGVNAPVKRCEFVTMLARLSGAALPNDSGTFQDVASTAYYAGAVAWAVQAGIVTGVTADTFQPERSITRQDMALMLYRYGLYLGLELPAAGSLAFSDQSAIGAYAWTAVSAMQQAGIVTGYPDGSFQPQGETSRAEAAVLLIRMDHLSTVQ